MHQITTSFLLLLLGAHSAMADVHYVRADFRALSVDRLEGQAAGMGFASGSVWDSGSDALWVRDRHLEPIPPRSITYVPSQYGDSRLMQGTSEVPDQQSRELAAPMNGMVWFSFLVRQHAEEGVAGIGFNQQAAAQTRPGITAVGKNLVISYPGPGNDIILTDVFRLGETALVLGKIEVNAGAEGQDHISIWVDPDVRDRGEPLVSATGADLVGDAITRLGLISYGGPGEEISGELDEIILSNHPYPYGFFHAAPRPKFRGPWHLPAQVTSERPQLPPPGYELVFSDHFEGDAVDEDKWDYRLRPKDFSDQRAENVEVADGKLIIHLRKEQSGDYGYTGGGVHSKQKFVYGYYESRFKVPAAEGWHTSFWAMPVWDRDVRGSELDFCEQDSGDPYLYSFGVIDQRADGWRNRNVARWVIEDAPNMVEHFAVVSAEFTPDVIRFYLNGYLKKELCASNFPHGPMDVRLTSIATRKKGDRFQDDARLPDKAIFDYVKVYQHPQYREAEEAAMQAYVPRERFVEQPIHVIDEDVDDSDVQLD